MPCVYVEDHRVVKLSKNDPLFVGKKPNGVVCTEYPDGKLNPETMTYYKSSHGHNNSVINGIGRTLLRKLTDSQGGIRGIQYER